MIYSIEVSGKYLVFTDGHLALALVSSVEVFERDGYYSNAGFKRSEDRLSISTHDAGAFAGDSVETKAAKKLADEKTSQWAAEYNKRNALEKEVAELKAQVAALVSVKSCAAADGPVASAMDEGETPVFGDGN